MKKKLLFITSRPPYPVINGQNVRSYGLIRMLSEKYDIDLLTLTEKNIDLSPIQPPVNHIYTFQISKWRSCLKTLTGLLTNLKPLQVNYYYSRSVKKWVDEHIGNYDFVFCNSIRTAEYARNAKITKCLDFIDSITMNYNRAYQDAKGIWKIIYAIERKRLREYEKSMLSVFDKKIVISEIDKKFMLAGAENNRLSVVQNFFSPDDLVDQGKTVPHRIGFFGKMNYEPNVQAALFFCNRVFPAIREQCPDSRFVIMGANPTKKVLNLPSRNKNVDVTGFIDNIRQELTTCHVVVAPMVSGSGIQCKILESMALGKCVVTTKIGAEGLIHLKGDELVICDTTEAMANRIVELFNHPEEISKIGNHARCYIEEYYSYQKVSRDLFDAI